MDLKPDTQASTHRVSLYEKVRWIGGKSAEARMTEGASARDPTASDSDARPRSAWRRGADRNDALRRCAREKIRCCVHEDGANHAHLSTLTHCDFGSAK